MDKVGGNIDTETATQKSTDGRCIVEHRTRISGASAAGEVEGPEGRAVVGRTGDSQSGERGVGAARRRGGGAAVWEIRHRGGGAANVVRQAGGKVSEALVSAEGWEMRRTVGV